MFLGYFYIPGISGSEVLAFGPGSCNGLLCSFHWHRRAHLPGGQHRCWAVGVDEMEFLKTKTAGPTEAVAIRSFGAPTSSPIATQKQPLLLQPGCEWPIFNGNILERHRKSSRWRFPAYYPAKIGLSMQTITDYNTHRRILWTFRSDVHVQMPDFPLPGHGSCSHLWRIHVTRRH